MGKHSTRGTALALLSAFTIGVAATGSTAAGVLHALAWEGYTDESLTSVFAERTGCEVQTTFIGSNEEIIAKLAGGAASVYDIISPDVDAMRLLVELGVIEPLDPARLEHFGSFPDAFRNHPDVKDASGTIWGVPYVWGGIPIMYLVEKFPEPPNSVEIFWDPQYAGKISLFDNKANLYMAARLLWGRDFDAYHMTDEQLAQVRDKLIEQKRLTRKYWATAGELVNLFANGEVWLSTTWTGFQSYLLAEQGIEVAEVVPDEKADGWQSVWQVVKGTPNLDCAYEWLNFASSLEGQCGIFFAFGTAPANIEALKTCLSEEEYDALDFTDPAYLANISFPITLDRPEDHIAAWNAVKSAN